MSELTYSVLQFRCDQCGEIFYPHVARLIGSQQEDIDALKRWHQARHDSGRCPLCGHWNDQHQDSKDFPTPVEGWHNGPLICGAPAGMGDFCGCGVIKD